jgi:hypothetical protein
MPGDWSQTALERVLAAVGQCLDRQSAESRLRLRADTEMQVLGLLGLIAACLV